MSVKDLIPFSYIIPFQGLRHLLRVCEDLGRCAVSGLNIEPGRVSQRVSYSFVARGLLHFSEGTVLSHDLAGVIREDKDLASLVLHGLLSAEAKNQLLLLKVMDVSQDGTRSGAGGRLWLEGAVRPVDFDWMRKVFLTEQFGDSSGDKFSGSTFLLTLLYPHNFDVVPLESGPPGQAPWYEADGCVPPAQCI